MAQGQRRAAFHSITCTLQRLSASAFSNCGGFRKCRETIAVSCNGAEQQARAAMCRCLFRRWKAGGPKRGLRAARKASLFVFMFGLGSALRGGSVAR